MRQCCETCKHFVSWETSVFPATPDAHGVCTAPRPQYTLQGNREVSKGSGNRCHVWQAKEPKP